MKTASALVAALAFASVGAAMPSPMMKRATNDTDVWDSLRGKIKHIVYLMMENHSFDNIAGYWTFHPNIDNLVNREFCNNYTNPNWTVWNEPLQICASPYEQEVPLKDPDHDFAGTSYELYQKWQPTNDDVPTMGGFIERESALYNATPGDVAFVIQAYSEEKSHTLATIAKNFAFWDTYHAEHPGPTNPNRQFATSASSCGYVDNTNQASGWFSNTTGTNCSRSIFQALSENNISWKNYYETDIIDSWMYQWVQENAIENIVHAGEFYSDIANGTLPTFSYINPECCTIDSMHPTSNMAAGEQLIKHVYDAIRNSQYWDNTLFILNFDEHGGFADHVPPPVNIPAPGDGITFSGISDGHNVTYDYTRLGVRVPAFIISPWLAPNTLIHDEGTMYAANSAYTHSSFLHFMQKLWNLGEFNQRVEWAKTFEYAFTDTLRDDCPKTLPIPKWLGGSSAVQPQPFYELNQPYSYYADLD